MNSYRNVVAAGADAPFHFTAMRPSDPIVLGRIIPNNNQAQPLFTPLFALCHERTTAPNSSDLHMYRPL
jgi:hypothetical protein